MQRSAGCWHWPMVAGQEQKQEKEQEQEQEQEHQQQLLTSIMQLINKLDKCSHHNPGTSSHPALIQCVLFALFARYWCYTCYRCSTVILTGLLTRTNWMASSLCICISFSVYQFDDWVDLMLVFQSICIHLNQFDQYISGWISIHYDSLVSLDFQLISTDWMWIWNWIFINLIGLMSWLAVD